jgi:hypothetical protein
MMRNSFSSVTNVWTSFTKAGGAAQRIMSLLSLQPALRNDEGEVIKKDLVRGIFNSNYFVIRLIL